MKPVELRPLAEQDLVDRTRHYRSAGGVELGARFLDAAILALERIEEMPGVGSSRIGELIGIDGLRRAGVAGFPCGWLYLERTAVVDVIRLVADRQDLDLVFGEVEPE